ncbi:hypothetical protein [Xanthocytophaga agilis]|uniref:Uncharacterized protein n=1 Tax=Xanthocytophaga agilis TaxID=3048010 RepID=A0AAE3RD85_9BACT|nr:hypothetical protein [Xanthocytophaga agilis]MDJ1506224.1 hypothetical protein [Xanthocytophaga agilis]
MTFFHMQACIMTYSYILYQQSHQSKTSQPEVISQTLLEISRMILKEREAIDLIASLKNI